MSLTPEPWMAWPWKNLRRRNTGWSRRRAITALVNSISAAASSSSSQSTQEISLSWQRRRCCALGAAELVAGQQHRHPGRQQQAGQEVALLALAQVPDLEVVGGPLARSSRSGCLRAVPVALAVGLVVLVVVADQVVQGEAVVAGDEVDAGVRPAAVGLVQVAGAGEPVGDVGHPGAGGARSRAWCRGSGRSTRSTAPGSCRPGSRPRRRPRARRSA